MDKNKFYYELTNNIERIKSYSSEYFYDANKYNMGKCAYLVPIRNEKDISYCRLLEQDLKRLGCNFPVIALIEEENKYLSKHFNYDEQQFRIIENNFDEDILKDIFYAYNKVCLINQTNFKIKDNLDCLFSNFLNKNKKEELLKKYSDFLILINLKDLIR